MQKNPYTLTALLNLITLLVFDNAVRDGDVYPHWGVGLKLLPPGFLCFALYVCIVHHVRKWERRRREELQRIMDLLP
jgi:hypothetical protein